MKKRLWLLAAALFILGGCQNRTGQSELTPSVTATPVLTATATPTPKTYLTVPVSYNPVIIEGTTEICCKAGEGIELDLNRDGTPEKIYVSEEGIFINDILQELEHLGDVYWIVDVDTQDDYYNLVFSTELGADSAESIMYYEGILKEIGSMQTFGSGRSGFSTAEYHGDGTFIVKNALMEFLGIQWTGDKEYEIGKDGDIKCVDDYSACLIPYELKLIDTIVMHAEPEDTAKELTIVPQTVYGLGTLKDEWACFQLEDGTKAWLHFGIEMGTGCVLDDGRSVHKVLEGFPTAG